MKLTHALFLGLLITCAASAEPFIVENGQPRAEIVIAENPLPATRLAAQELQDGIRKMSGAHLPIVNQPGAGKTHLFVGPSTHTERLRLSTADLKHGAFRMVSGEDWLALLGEDTAFTPIEPWGRHNADLTSGRAQNEWREKTSSLWGLPNLLIYKDRLSLPGITGLPDALRGQGKLPPLEIWAQDERGSFNAVCGWLMKLGARWYAPGEIGEVMPSLPAIPLPKLDETVRPDFPIRRFNVRLGIYGPDTAMWAMRLGLRDPYGIECAHGMDTITNHAEVFAKHPEWYALVGGQRRFQPGPYNHLCYSNEELLRETVRYVRAVFDHYQMDVVSVMPPDGYTSICQCDLCKGKDSPERDRRGLASDYIWDFVNRVAKEVRQTHPDKRVLNCGYGIYTLPPLKLDKLEPNVVVSIVGGRRPMNNQPADQEDTRQLREAWLAKTSQPLIIFENYPLTDRGWYLPAFTPHSLGASINATKGISQGEDICLSMRQGDFEKQPDAALNHFMVYFTQRMYWGGREADVDAMFREYCRLFYGPAEQEMHAFFTHCEAHWQAMEKDKSLADAALALFDQAKVKSDSASIYGRRLAMMDVFIKGLRNKAAQLGRLRGPMPVLRLVGPPKSKITVDGKLDDEAWVNCPSSATVRLRELQTGRQPIFGSEHSALSPTGADHFHAAMKFATFYDGNSFEFDHGTPEDDFLEKIRIAADLARTGKREEAIAAYTTAAEGQFTDLQKSHALELAAQLARSLKQTDRAAQLITRIPVPAARKAAQMLHLIETGHAPDVIRDFSGEDIGTWPFWKRGDAYHARGRAWFTTKAGDKAATDLTTALEWTSESVKRDAIWLLLAQNHESNLKNDAQALAAYNTIVEGRTHIGGASEFAALQGIARIQTRQGQFDEALKTLNRAQPEKIQGVWRDNIQKSIEAVNQARKQPASN